VSEGGRPPGVFSVAEFRVLWAAAAQSIVGDQLARVALSILVFQRTGSAGWTAAMYALTQLPALLSGVLLSGLADRYPRRAVMVGCDLARAGLVGVMALPGAPLALLAALLVVVQLADAPFAAAQGATLPHVLPGERFERGQRVLLITHQAGLLAGFAVGGIMVAWVGTHTALAVDAVTFLLSAALIRAGVRARPVSGERGQRMALQVRSGARLIWGDRRLRALVGLAWLAGFAVVPEGLAAPFAAEVGVGVAAVGWLLAADPAGMVVGAWLLGKLSTERRLRLLGLLAIGTALPLACYAFAPSLAVALCLLAVSGACSAYQVTAGATFVQLVPDHQRGQALGLARSGLVAAQGFGVAAGGVLAELLGRSSTAIAIAGVAGLIFAVNAAAAWARVDPRRVAAALNADN
jgi:MFS family permease